MLKIGITGQKGFVGTHLYNTLKLAPNEFSCIDYDISFFSIDAQLDAFVAQCDVIVHLAAMNRHNKPAVLYNTNIELVKKLISSLDRTGSKALFYFRLHHKKKEIIHTVSQKKKGGYCWKSGLQLMEVR